MPVHYASAVPDHLRHMAGSIRRHSAFLREHREALGINGPEMARRMNAALDTTAWDKSTVARYERKERSLNPDLEDAYARVFGIEVAELYEPPLPPGVPNINKKLKSAGADPEMWRLIGALTDAAIARQRESEG